MASQFDVITFMDSHIWMVGAVGGLVFIGITYLTLKFAVKKLELHDNFPKERLQLLAKLDKKEAKPVPKALKKKGKNKKDLVSADESKSSSEPDTARKQNLGLNTSLPAVVSHSGTKQGEAAKVQSASKSTSLHDASVPAKQTETPDVQVAEARQPKINQELECIRKENVHVKASPQASSVPAKQKETPVVQIAEARQPKVNQELEGIRKENFDLKARLQAASEHAKQAEILKAQLAEARKPKVNQELELIRKENFDMKARLQAAAEHAKQAEILKSQLAEARRPNPELESIRKENFDLKARLQAASEHAKQAEILKAQLAEARQPKANPEFENARKEIFDLKARLQAAAEHAKQAEILKAQLAEARRPNPELENIRKENFDLKARLQAASEHVKQTETKLAEAERISSQSSVESMLQKRVDDLEEELLNAKRTLEDASNVVAALEVEKKSHLAHDNQIVAEVEALHREIDSLKRGLESTRIEKENIVQASNHSEETFNKMNHQIDELEKKNEMCTGAIAKLNVELRKASAETMEHKKERDDMKKTVESLMSEKEALTQLADINEKKIADFTNYYDETSSRIRELQNLNNSVELEKNDLKLQLGEERARVEELEENAKTLNSTVKEDGKVEQLEAEVEKLKQKKDELYQLTISLGEKVRAAENQAEQALKADNKKSDDESFKKAAAVIAQTMKSMNVKVSEANPQSLEDFTQWAQGLPPALKKVMPAEKPSSSTASHKQPSQSNEEVKKLKDQVQRYEHSLDVLDKQLRVIEAAYAEREAELKAEINALEQTQRS